MTSAAKGWSDRTSCFVISDHDRALGNDRVLEDCHENINTASDQLKRKNNTDYTVQEIVNLSWKKIPISVNCYHQK